MHFQCFNIEKRKSLEFPIYKPKVYMYLIYGRGLTRGIREIYIPHPGKLLLLGMDYYTGFFLNTSVHFKYNDQFIEIVIN